MKNAVVSSVMFALCLLVAMPALAGEGRVPIWEPTTITESGKYVVTRNIWSPSGSGPTIRVANGVENVEIDLNGQALHGDPTLFADGIITAQQVENITVRNGVIWGMGSTGPEAAIYVSVAQRAVVEDITCRNIAGSGIAIDSVAIAHLRRNAVLNATSTAISLQGNPGGVQITGEIEDNAVWNSPVGIAVSDAASVGIRNNRIVQVEFSGVSLHNCLSCLIVDNTVEYISVGHGILLVDSEGCELRGNSVTNAALDGILITGDGNFVVDNTVRRAGRDGLRIHSLENHIERNLLVFNGQSASGWGLHFLGSASSNTYGRNTARSNPGPAASCSGGPTTTNDLCDEGSGDTSFGDNMMPGPPPS